MEDYIVRMIEERDQLNERLRKLFIFRTSEKFYALTRKQKFLLNEQFDAMRRYEDVLTRRIENEQTESKDYPLINDPHIACCTKEDMEMKEDDV